MTKKEMFNARNASKPIEDGLNIDVKDVDYYKDVTKDGVDCEVTVFLTVDGACYSTISSQVARCREDLKEIITEDGHVVVGFRQYTSKNNRDFYTCEIVE